MANLIDRNQTNIIESKEEKLEALKREMHEIENEIEAAKVVEVPEKQKDYEDGFEKSVDSLESDSRQMVTPINFAVVDDDGQQVSDDDSDDLEGLDNKELEEQVTVLVKLALTKGVDKAVETARGINNPYVLDELHDTLVDHLYDQLIRMGKIEKN